MAATDDKCENCVYWVTLPEPFKYAPTYGECHRMPPNLRDGFVPVDKNTWCGEFKKKV